MGKKVAPKKTVTKATKAEEPVAAEVVEDTVTVAQKKANDLKVKKQLKKMAAQVAEKVDLKQVVSAAKALKAFSKKQSEA